MKIEQRIGNYIARYAPSQKKLIAYLEKKHVSNIELFLKSIGYNENIMLEAWIRTYIHTGKPKRDILQKLLIKWFNKDDILKSIETNCSDIEDWSSQREHIEMSIQSKLRKGKSKKIILLEFSGAYPYFHDEIQDYIMHLDDTQSLNKYIEIYKKKYNISDTKEKQKCIQALMRRGFLYENIKNAL